MLGDSRPCWSSPPTFSVSRPVKVAVVVVLALVLVLVLLAAVALVLLAVALVVAAVAVVVARESNCGAKHARTAPMWLWGQALAWRARTAERNPRALGPGWGASDVGNQGGIATC